MVIHSSVYQNDYSSGLFQVYSMRSALIVLLAGAPQCGDGILVCAAPTGFSLGSVFGNPESSMQDESREEEVMGGPVPYTVVRFEPLLDQMGGQCGIELYQGEGAPAGGKLTREDAAIVIARAAENPPGPSAGAVFDATASAAAAPSSEDWEAKFAQLDTSLLQAAPKPA